MIDRGTIVYNIAKNHYYLCLGVSTDEKYSFELTNLYNVTSSMSSDTLILAYSMLGAKGKEEYWKRCAELFGNFYYDLGTTYDSSFLNQEYNINKVKFVDRLFYFELDFDKTDKIEEKVLDTWILKNRLLGIEIGEFENLDKIYERNRKQVEKYNWNFKATKDIMKDIVFRYLASLPNYSVLLYEKENKLYYVSYVSKATLDVVSTKITKTRKLEHYVYAILKHLVERQITLKQTMDFTGYNEIDVKSFQ